MKGSYLRMIPWPRFIASLFSLTGVVDQTHVDQTQPPPFLSSVFRASLCQDVLVKLIWPSRLIPRLFWLPHELAQLHHHPCYATILTCCDGWLRQLWLRSLMHLKVQCSKVNRKHGKRRWMKMVLVSNIKNGFNYWFLRWF